MARLTLPNKNQMMDYIANYSMWKSDTWEQWSNMIGNVAGVLILDIDHGMLKLLTDCELVRLFDYCRARSFAGNPIGLP